MAALSGKQVRHLRGLGHHLNPVVMLGKDGITDALVAATDEALTAHELIKVRLQEGCLLDRKSAASDLAAKTGSQVAQVLGKTFLLFRANPDDPVIKLP
ncbi:MAG: ribosome assembly RNA-binding protein YhbY [Desulfuromonas sp.]|nr:MAG: ribosome assembly RNA-binding protein YhbY [Desulfuromonas sp.]